MVQTSQQLLDPFFSDSVVQQNGRVLSYSRDFLGAQKIEDLSESKKFFAELFQITSRFVLARKKFGVKCTLKETLVQVLGG